MSPGGRIAAAAARRLAQAGCGGLYDLGRLATLVVPDDRLDLDLDGATPGDEPWFRRPPSSPTPFSPIEAAYDPRPRLVRESRVVELDDARLVGSEGVVLDPRSGRLWYPSASSRESVAAKLDRPRRPRLLHAPQARRGPLVFLPTFRSENYFHFVTDVLTRLHAFRDGGAGGASFVLDAAEPEWQRDLLRLLGHEPRVERLSRGTHWRVGRLLFPTFVGVKHPSSEVTLFPPAVLEWLGEAIRCGAGAALSPRRRLYVSRGGADWRRVANEDEVERALAARGFEPVRAERLTAVEQVRLFAEAEVVVAPHGAGLANLVFAGPETVVVELHTPRFHSACYYGLADALGQDYRYVAGEPVGDGYDFTVPVEALVAALP